MKSTELMIGDLVLLFGDTPARVGAIGNTEVYVYEKELGDWHVGYEHIKPIPLTPEILEKNGWTYNKFDKVFYSAQLRGELPWMVGTNGVFRVRDFCEIRYVHELQNALRICGIEKVVIL